MRIQARYRVIDVHDTHRPQFLSRLIEQGFTPEFVRSRHREWREKFYFHANGYYIGLRTTLEEVAIKEFAAKESLEIDDILCCDSDSLIEYKWETFKDESGYNDAVASCRALHDRNIAIHHSVIPESKRGLHPLSAPEYDQFLSDMIDRGDSDYLHLPLSEFTRDWFNSFVSNSPERQKEMRAMPYRDYLQTDHWLKVRVAMLVITNAKCQALRCWETGETAWAGFESDLHVHHLTYKNRGNERFDDLVVLCNRHHEQWHNEKDAGEVTMEMVRNDPFDLF